MGVVSVIVSARTRQALLRLRYLDPLLLPDLNLAIFRYFARPTLIVFNRLGFLAMGCSPEGMASLRPEIKCCSVSDNLVSG